MNNEIECFGITRAELDTWWADAPTYIEPMSIVRSMLSDSQEQIALGQYEIARQTINKVKYILTTKIK